MGRLTTILRAIMGTAARRPLPVGLAVTLLALAGAALALRLQPTTAERTLVGRSSPSYEATQREQTRFGSDAVIVLVKGSVARLVLTRDINTMVGLEGCLAGNVPATASAPGGPAGPCARLAELKPAQVVIGPGTFINTSVNRIADEYTNRLTQLRQDMKTASGAAYKLAKGRGYTEDAARRLADDAAKTVQLQGFKTLLQMGLQYRILEPPTLNDQSFVSQLVFASGAKAGTPKARFAYLFPNADSALVSVRLRPDLSDAGRREAIALIRSAVRMPQWRLANGQQVVVTGAPVVLSDLTTSVSRSIVVLLVAALVVMALTLALVLHSRLRLWPLVVALAAAAMTFGALSAVGASLTMASIGVAPVLIGLAVDYAVQLQARIEERGGRRARRPEGLRAAVAHVAGAGAPTITVAAAATAAGFAVLALSPVPMVRGFGLLLVVGIAVALLTALTLGVVGLAGLGTRPVPRPLAALARRLGPAARGAGELARGNPVSRALRARATRVRFEALLAAGRRPERVLLVAAVAAVVGWAADTQTRVETDVTKLVPADLPALRDLQALQRATGVGGQIDVLVEGDDLTNPKVITWMTRYQAALTKRFGYSEKRGCGRAELCPAFSLPDLFRGAKTPTRPYVDALLDAVPPYFSQSVISADRRAATMAFGIRLMPLSRQQEVIATMRDELRPPPGVRASLAGLPVLAADANAAVASPWRRIVMLLAGLGAVALVLLVALRSWRRALVPLVPIVLATGWSALVLFATRIPLNPMSVTMGALVIAISTEFSVLLAERYRAERRAGHDPASALERTYRFTGAAVVASGATAIAGFAVLVLSDIRLLRDFGAVTVIDLTISLLGVLFVLPSVLMLAERPHPLGSLVHRRRGREGRLAASAR